MAEQLVIVTTHTGKEVKVKKSDWDAGNISAMRQYAVQTGQATRAEAFPPDALGTASPATEGVLGNIAVSMGRGLDLFGSNVKQAFGEVAGLNENVKREKAYQAEVNRLAEPGRERRPISSFVGEAGSTAFVPGGKIAQTVAGAAEGALQGDTFGERAGGAALGAAFGLGGQKLGDYIGKKVNQGFQRLTGNPKSPSLDILQRAGVPVSIADRTRDPLARLTEDFRGILLNSRNPLEGSQVKQLNRLALRSIGEEGTEVTRDSLGKAHTRLGSVFESAADNVNEIPFNQSFSQRLSDLGEDVASVETQGAAIRRYYDEILDAATGGRPISGQRYNQLRNRLGKASRAAWKQGDELAAETADSMMEIVDDAMAEAAPQISDALSDARRQWRMLRVLRRARSIDPEGNVNQRSLLNAFDQVYPGAQVGKFPFGPEGELGKVLAAFENVVRPRLTSRTAENLIRFGAPSAAIGAGLTGGAPGVLAGLGGILASVSGGGTGGLTGGTGGRSLLQFLLEQSRQQERK